MSYISSKVIRIPSADISFSVPINLSSSYGLPDSFRLYGLIVSGSPGFGASAEFKVIFYDGEDSSKDVVSLSVGNSAFGTASVSNCMLLEDNSYIGIDESLFVRFTSTTGSLSGKDLNMTVFFQ